MRGDTREVCLTVPLTTTMSARSMATKDLASSAARTSGYCSEAAKRLKKLVPKPYTRPKDSCPKTIWAYEEEVEKFHTRKHPNRAYATLSPTTGSFVCSNHIRSFALDSTRLKGLKHGIRAVYTVIHWL